MKNRGWTVVQDHKKRMGPYAFLGNQWVSYDDVAMIKLKVGPMCTGGTIP